MVNCAIPYTVALLKALTINLPYLFSIVWILLGTCIQASHSDFGASSTLNFILHNILFSIMFSPNRGAIIIVENWAENSNKLRKGVRYDTVKYQTNDI